MRTPAASPPPDDVLAFRRRAVSVAGPTLAVGLVLLALVLELTDPLIIWIDVTLLLSRAAVHAAAAATVGRRWEPGGLVGFVYIAVITLLISGSFLYADTPQSDAFWFLLIPIGLSAVTMGPRDHTVLTALGLISYLVVTPFGPGLDPAITGSRTVSMALFAVAMGLFSSRLEAALTEAERARAALADNLDELASANSRLTELDRAKDTFVSTVSHELRTPLTVILGMTRTLDTRWDDLDDGARRQFASRVAASASGLDGIISAMLDLARIERGGLDPLVAPVQVGEAVDTSVARLGPVLDEHAVVVAVDPTLVVATDVRLLERILDNLLSNAARHTPVGTTVTVSAAARDDRVRIAVADGGPGIAPDDVARLGEQFFRVGAEQDPDRDGLGLGLSLVVELLRTLGEELEVTSEVGRGTTFAFSLSRVSDEVAVT